MKTSLLFMGMTFTLAFTVQQNDCNAQDRDFFINEGRDVWIAGRDEDDAIPTTDGAKCIVVRIFSRGLGNRVKARVWLYNDVEDGHYSDRDELTRDYLLTGRVEKIGIGKHKRLSLTLANEEELPGLSIYLSGRWIRKGDMEPSEKHILCRFRYYDPDKKKRTVLINCDEPPTEDVLEEEPLLPEENTEETPPEEPPYYEP